jgi:hypothetical protein
MQELEQRLSEWAEAGLITADQADRIAEFERQRHRKPGPERGRSSSTVPPARRVAVAEAVGYVGAALALAAIGLFVGDVWPQLNVGGQLALVGLLTVLVAGAGQAVHGQPAPAMQRLTGVLWAAASLGSSWFAGIVAADLVMAGTDATTTTAGVVAMLTAVPLLLRRPSVPLHLVGIGGAIATALSVSSLAALQPDIFWDGLLVIAVGGAWLLLGRGGWLAPRRVAEVLGAVAALLGAQVASFGDLRVPALALALLLAVGLVALAVLQEDGHHLIVGALGLFVLVPQLVFEVFGDALGAPATLLVIGLLLVLLAVGLGRARREVGTDRRRDDDGAAGLDDAPPDDDRMGADR